MSTLNNFNLLVKVKFLDFVPYGASSLNPLIISGILT